MKYKPNASDEITDGLQEVGMGSMGDLRLKNLFRPTTFGGKAAFPQGCKFTVNSNSLILITT